MVIFTWDGTKIPFQMRNVEEEINSNITNKFNKLFISEATCFNLFKSAN